MNITHENYSIEIDAVIEAQCKEITVPFSDPGCQYISLYEKSNGKVVKEEMGAHGWNFVPGTNRLVFNLEGDHEERQLSYLNGLEKLRDLFGELDDYPLLNDEDYYDSIREEGQKVWDNCGMAYDARCVLHKLMIVDVLVEPEHPDMWKSKMFDVIDCIDEDNNEGFKVLMEEIQSNFIASYEEDCNVEKFVEAVAKEVYSQARRRSE